MEHVFGMRQYLTPSRLSEDYLATSPRAIRWLAKERIAQDARHVPNVVSVT